MARTSPQPKPNEKLWGDFALSEEVTGFWQIGPLKLWVRNYEHEWRIHTLNGGDALETTLRVEVPSKRPPNPKADIVRFSFLKMSTTLKLSPLLADRAVVVKPETPFYVLKGEEATLFVSTPLWVQLSLKKFGTLIDVPTYRPSDTWFGRSTLVGELCYASRTAGYLDLDELERLPHRAVTPIRVRNRADNALLLERIKLPVQYLSVYRSASERLWTEQLTLTRQEDGDLAELQIGSQPKEAGASDQLSPPRQHAERNLVVRAFSKLFRDE